MEGTSPTVSEWFAQQMRDFDSRTEAFRTDFAYPSTDEGPNWGGMPVPQVCYDTDYITGRWSWLGEIVSVTHEAEGFQTGVLFKKREEN